MKLVYLHGFRSSGQTATAKRLQKHLPWVEVISPDIALDPVIAISKLKTLAGTLGPDDIIVGTSMGAMFALLFRGRRRVLINPSLHPSRKMREFLGQTVEYFTPRQDKIQSFKVTEKLCKKYEDVEARLFDPKFGIMSGMTEEDEKILAFFGTNDDTVDCRAEYLEHYTQARTFEGGHRLDPETTLNIIVPEIKKLLGKEG